MTTITCQTTDGKDVQFVDQIIGSGAMKDVYFSPDRSYVVAFYKTAQDFQAKERLKKIVDSYYQALFVRDPNGEYWRSLFCWPTAMVEHGGKTGIVAPAYAKNFFFEYGSKDNDTMRFKGQEKQGKWFASANLRKRFLDPRELGDWLTHLKMCLLLSRAIKKMHAMGLAHSDLSYKNVLVDPVNGAACVIDVDGLVVPDKFPPDVVGTPDFIAPEVVATSHLEKTDPNRRLPCRATDCHALAVLIYIYLLYRHPLRGGKVHDVDDEQNDEKLSMGAKALFVEHPTDPSNCIKIRDAKPSELPWADTAKLPYTLTGPYLSELFRRAFIDGLHNPIDRPTASDWERELVKTVDLIQPCQNPQCEQKWYVFDNSKKPKCPFCGTPYTGKLPVLNLYSSRVKERFLPDNHRLMVWSGQSLFLWHANRLIAPNERLSEAQRRRVGYFVFHNNSWWLVNEGLPDLTDVTGGTKTPIPVNNRVELKDGGQLLLSKEDGGRLVVIQMVDA